jgi:hypothetical protein
LKTRPARSDDGDLGHRQDAVDDDEQEEKKRFR